MQTAFIIIDETLTHHVFVPDVQRSDRHHASPVGDFPHLIQSGVAIGVHTRALLFRRESALRGAGSELTIDTPGKLATLHAVPRPLPVEYLGALYP